MAIREDIPEKVTIKLDKFYMQKDMHESLKRKESTLELAETQHSGQK